MKGYLATQKDLRAIEDGTGYVWHPELNFIFKDKEKLKDIIVISFDSKNLYVWKHKESKISLAGQKQRVCPLPDYDSCELLHGITIENKYLLGWAADKPTV